MTGRRVHLLMVCPALLAGCTVGPDYVRPANAALGVPAAFREPAPIPMAGDVAPDWWMGFSDPVLDRLVSVAVADNTDIAGAVARLRSARALAREAFGARLPTLGLSGSASRTIGAPRLAGSPAPDGGLSPVTPTVGGDTTIFQAGLDTSWDADLFGGLRRGAEAARADLAAAGYTLANTQAVVVAEVATAYIDLRSAQARLAIARSQLISQERSAEIVGWRVRAGLASQGDYESVRALREQTASLIPAFDEAAGLAAHRIAVLTGQAPALSSGLIDSATPVPMPATLPATGIPIVMLQRRPDVIAAERRLAAETARIGVQTAQLYPALAISGTFGASGTSLAGLPSAALANLVGTLTAPLFQGGRIRARIEVQRGRADLAFADYRGSVLVAMEEVENALVSTRTSEERQRHLAAAIDASTIALTVARGRYRSGLTDFQTLLNAERAELSARDGEAIAQAARAQAAVRLFRALGGGWTR